MSDTIEEYEEVTLEDLDHYWMENGLPVFMANRPDICDIVENMGFQIYYLLTNNNKTTSKSTTNPTTKVVTSTSVTVKSMQLFKVVNSYVGRTVSMSNDPFDHDFVQIEEEAVYTMPPIPLEIINKLDQFFRLVETQHGTESIVMLTYDTTLEGSQGWGVLVPDQQNTSVHCNYDPNSVAEVKPDHVMIVGSVHSHPNMSAYASGTDHEDQADFDGIHITYGWQKSSNNGATQYHIELQMAGKAYVLKPEDVFEDYFIDKTPDPEVVEWSSKVKKVFPPTWGATSQASASYPPKQTGAELPTTTVGTSKPSIDGLSVIRSRFNTGSLEIEPNAIVVAELDIKDNKFVNCLVCQTLLDDYNIYNGYCDECYIPVCYKNASIGSIVASLGQYCVDFNVASNVPVYLWTIDEDKTESLMKIVDTTLDEYLTEEIAASQISDKYEIQPKNDLIAYASELADDRDDFTYCCSKHISLGCDCQPRATVTELLQFDALTKHINMYAKMSDCSSCEFYYDFNCPRWQAKAFNYLVSGELNYDNLVESITDSGCPSFIEYSRLNNSYLYEES